MIRNWLIKILRIPPEPDMPAGSTESLRVFRAAPSYYKYAVFKFVMAQLGAIIGIIVSFRFVQFGADGSLSATIFFWLEIVGVTLWALQLPFSFLLIKFDYEFRWYIVTDRSLRIREGVRRIREMTMTFANIQNIYIDQGPVQRYLGIANLRVQTAGGGGLMTDTEGQGNMESMHIGFFRGVDNSEEIRTLMMNRLRRYQDSGLGNPDDVENSLTDESEVGEPAKPAILLAAEELLNETRELRKAALTARQR